jgi:hypothetical protein
VTTLNIPISRYLELLISELRDCAIEDNEEILIQLRAALRSDVTFHLETLGNGKTRIWKVQAWRDSLSAQAARKETSVRERQARFERDAAFDYILRLAQVIASKLNQNVEVVLPLAKQLIDFPTVVSSYGVSVEIHHSAQAIASAKIKEI